MRRFSSQQSKNFRAKRRIRLVLLSVGALVVLAVCIYLLSLISSLKFLSITNIQVSGISSEKTAPIHALAMEKIQGKYLGLFSRANTVLYPRWDISNAIKDNFFEIENIKVRHTGFKTIAIEIDEKDPAVVACAKLPDWDGSKLSLENIDSCYFVDREGYIFQRARMISEESQYRRYYVPELSDRIIIESTGTSTFDSLIGTQMISASEFSSIQSFFDGLIENKIKADAVLLKGNQEYEMYARNPGTESTTVVIYFSTLSLITEQLENLISFWAHSIGDAAIKKEKLEFSYIDVRYGDNVFFQKVGK